MSENININPQKIDLDDIKNVPEPEETENAAPESQGNTSQIPDQNQVPLTALEDSHRKLILKLIQYKHNFPQELEPFNDSLNLSTLKSMSKEQLVLLREEI